MLIEPGSFTQFDLSVASWLRSENGEVTVYRPNNASVVLATGDVVRIEPGHAYVRPSGTSRQSFVGVTVLPVASSPLQINTLEKMLRCAARARVSNPRINPLVAPAPTITSSLVTPPATVLTTALANPAKFSYLGSYPIDSLANPGNVMFWDHSPAATGAGGARSDPPKTSYRCRFGFVADAQVVHIGMTGWGTPTHRFIIDDRYVDLTGVVAVSGEPSWYTITFASKARRKIVVEGGGAGSKFYGVRLASTDSFYPLQDETYRLLIMGDSITAGTGAGAGPLANDGCAVVCGDFLGTYDCVGSGNPSSGYITDAGGTSYNHEERIFDATDHDADATLWFYGVNDVGFAPSVTANGLTRAYVKYRTACPSTPLFVTGSVYGASPAATMTAIETAYKQAVEGWRDVNAFFVPFTSGPNPIVFGTGHVGATTGDGNADVVIGSDGVHPTAAGHALIGERLASGIIAAIQERLR